MHDHEFCRFDLSKNCDNISNGNIVCSIARYAGDNWTNGETRWALKARGYYTYNTKTYKQIGPIVNQVIKNNFTNVKMLDREGNILKEYENLSKFDLKRMNFLPYSHYLVIENQKKNKKRKKKGCAGDVCRLI